MFRDHILPSMALGFFLLGSIILGASAHFGIDGIPLAITMGAGCFLMMSGSLQGALLGLCVSAFGAGLLGGALAQAGAVIPGWLSVAALVMTAGGLTLRILRPSY